MEISRISGAQVRMRALAAGCFGCIALLSGCVRFKPVEHRAEAAGPFVEARFPAAPDRVAAAVRRVIGRRARPIDFSKFQLYAHGEPIFPEDATLLMRTAGNPALARYLGRPPEARSLDLYAYIPLDYYWPSEYFYRGEPAPFSTDFLIHLRPEGADTVAEAIEFIPKIRVGKIFDPMGHAGPGMYDDIRFVAPTTRDGRVLLDAIRAALSPAAP